MLQPSSPQIVDHLAELTRHRDRELLDITLVRAFRNVLQPRSAAIYRRIGEAQHERWTLRARLVGNDEIAKSDPPWAKLNELPLLTEFPARCEALNGRTVLNRFEGGCCSIFPIATDRRVMGVLELETEAPLGAEAHRIVDSVLHIYRNFETLLDYSERDMLTGLLNRKTFDETFFKVATRPSPAPSTYPGDRRGAAEDAHFVALLDIDFFKSVNDKYGHLIGDEVLLLQAGLMRSTFRAQDRLFRFGGEEFVILMRCANSAGAVRALERLRSNTENYAFPQVGRVTLSSGVTQVRPDDSPSAALGRADKAVYYAKSNGRNQVQHYDDLAARGLIDVSSEKSGEIDLF